MRLITTFLAIAAIWTQSGTQSIAYMTRKVGKHTFHAVVADLNSENVKVSGVVVPKTGTTRSASKMVSSVMPDVAICGTFFCTTSKKPIGGIVLEGTEVAKGARGSALVVDYLNNGKVIDANYGQRIPSDGYRFMLRGGVRILTAGKTTIYPRDQKFRLSCVAGAAKRTAVGITGANKLVIIVSSEAVQLRDVAAAMKTLGVQDALSFDGGSSTTLYYRGKMLVSPARSLTNLMVLYESPGVAWQTKPVISR